MTGKQQEIYILNSPPDVHWNSAYVLQHEIGHALGLMHEHQRTDRGSFVRIFDHNIDPNGRGNFYPPRAARLHSPYDFNSIMHYGNCAFSKDPLNCTNATPNLWTMTASDCARDIVGGPTITQLDELAVQKEYGGSLAGIFEPHSGGNCGTLQYSTDQMAVACPGGQCETVGGVNYSKVDRYYEWGCPYIPARDGPQYCKANGGKDFMWFEYDSDCPHIRCGIGVCLEERWTPCGCSQQAVKASCLNVSKVSMKAVQDMQAHGTPREKQIANGIGVLMNMMQSGQAERAIEERIGRLVIKNFSGTQSGSLMEDLACYARIYLGLKRIVAPNYVLSWNDLARLVAGIGMTL